MKVRRTLALLGPLTAAGALLLPLYYENYDGTAVRGWDTLTQMNWLVLAIGLAIAVPVLRASAATARRFAVAGGGALAVIALRCLFVPWEHGDGPWDTWAPGPGAWLLLAAGAGTIVAGRALHAHEGDVATVRRAIAVLGPLAAVSALCLPWFAYHDVVETPFPASISVERGWDDFTLFDAIIVAFGLAAATAAVAARRELARGACVLGGIALSVLAIVSLATQAEPTWYETLILTGPIITLVAGVATALLGFHLYAPRRSASSLITAS